MSNVALYARVSSEIQEKEATIESQVALLREAAAKQGDVVINEYRDDGFSGDLLARPALDRLRDDAAKGLFEKVLILATDRLARAWYLGEIVIEDLKKLRVSVQFLNQHNDGTPESALMLTIHGAFGQYEKAKLLERARRGRLYKARAGILMTSQAPYGYTYIPRTLTSSGQLVVDPEKSSIVRLIFDLCVNQGLSLSKIRTALYAKGIKPPCRLRPALYWCTATILKILHCQTYAGIWHFNKNSVEEPRRRRIGTVIRRLRSSARSRPRDQWVPTNVPAVIPMSIWESAQEQLKKNTIFSKRNMKHEYLFKGLCVCGECGRTWACTPLRNGGYYVCRGPRLVKPEPRPCHIPSIGAARFDELIWKSIRNAFQNPRILVASMAKTNALLANGRTVAAAESMALNRNLAHLKEAESRLLEAYTAKAINLDQLKEQMKSIKARIETAQRAVPPVPRETFSPETIYSLVEKVGRGLDILENRFEDRRRFIEMVVDRIVMNKGEAVIQGGLPQMADNGVFAPMVS